MSDWVKLHGKATTEGDGIQLITNDGNGAIELNKNDVKVNGDEITVRVGAIAKSIKQPRGKAPDELPAAARNCPGEKTQCVGLVLLCCSNGSVLGPCIGAWGC